VHEHFSTDTPDAPNSISDSMMVDKNMFVARFITGAKVLKKCRNAGKFVSLHSKLERYETTDFRIFDGGRYIRHGLH
jgi:hypothetical protein